MSVGVAFMGGMGSGKTTLANFVAEEYGLVKTSLSYSLKIIAAQYLDIQDKTNPLARKAYQYIGHGFRQFSPTCWIRETLSRIQQHPQGGVLDDTHYVNEVAAFDEAGFTFFYVKTPIWQRIRRNSLRDFHKEPDLRTTLRLLFQMCHPSELNVRFAVREAKRRGNLVVLDGRKPIEELKDEVRRVLNAKWRD